MASNCDYCGKAIAGWPYSAATIAALATIVAVAAWTYWQIEALEMVNDSIDRAPWDVRPGMALMGGIAGLLAGLVVYADARITIFYGREMVAVRAAVRRAVRGGGRKCRWCRHCAGHGRECCGGRQSSGGRAADSGACGGCGQG